MCSILVVENNTGNKEVIKHFIKILGAIDFAENGENAVKMAQSKKYDAVLMDINLGPGINGIEATKIIKTFPEYGNVPIIANTANYSFEEQKLYYDNGFVECLMKPFTKESLIETITQHIPELVSKTHIPEPYKIR